LLYKLITQHMLSSVCYKIFLVSLIVAVSVSGCQPAASPKEQLATVADSITLITTGTTLEPRFKEMDSVSVLFYNDPFGADSDRYTRYYKTFTSNSDSLIDLLQANMAEPFTEDSLRNCRSEGKMYCFGKGKVIQTVYFNTKQDGCIQLYFIHTARYYYFKPLPALVTQLAKVKTLAKE